MSLQVSNQTSTGRRTPQVYQGFGGNVPTGAAAPGGGGGGPAANGAGGNVAGSQTRTTKGGAGGKQSQIPVAIGGTAGGVEVGSPSVPPTAVVHPGSGGNNAPVVADVPPLAFVGKKQQQFSSQQQAQQRMLEQYMQQQQAEAAAKDNATGGQKATNGSNANGGGVQQQPAVVEKNGTGTKKTDSESAKSSATTTNPPTEGAKVRDSPRSSGRTQKASDELLKASDQPAPKEKQQSSGGNKTPQKGTPGDSSLVAEKPLKGFDADGEEMESLLLEDWDLEELSKSSQQQGSAKSKLPKPSPTAMARVAPNKSTGKQTGDVKLETVVEQKPQPTVQEKSSPKATEAAAPGTPQSVGSELNIGRPLRSISGRRSTRPISDIKFTHHRKSSELNDSISSLNVTVGSDVYMDSLRTPGSATRKRKDMTPESTTEAVESPKRARLDFSGFLGMVATPVTMLKNRLSRVKLQSSTPRALAVEEEDASKVVTAEATTTTTVVAGDDAAKATSSSSNTMEVDEKDVTVATTEAKENKQEGEGSGGEPAKEEDDSNRQQSTSAVADANDEVEVKIVTDQPQKQWCSVM